jgi:hypothetical protein
VEHSTKLGETTPTSSQIEQKWHLQNEMPRLHTKIRRTNRQSIHLIPDTKNIYKQLEIIIAIQDIHILNTGHKHGTITGYSGHHENAYERKTLKHTRKTPHIQNQQQ